MLKIANPEIFSRYRQNERNGNPFTSVYFWLMALVFASMGAITWAIRGSAGWGGVDGTVVPGLMWGILFYYYCRRIGIEAGAIVFWLGMGIGLGGELGYGQYTSWILGKFYAGDEIIAIEPWMGYLWFMICGIGWAAPGGILLGWVLGGKKAAGQWILRVMLLVLLLVILFAWPFMDWLSMQVVQFAPGFLFPNAHLGIYDGQLGSHLQRTVYTNTQNFLVLLWWILALVTAVWQRDRKTVVSGLIIGGGFGLGFMQSAAWCLGYGAAADLVDWWKIWELNAGFNLGILYALVLWWAVSDLGKQQLKNKGQGVTAEIVEGKPLKIRAQILFTALAGVVLIFFMSFEYFFWTGIGLLVLFFISVSGTAGRTDTLRDAIAQRDKILLAYSVFLLLFLLFHGGSERAGVMLSLYPPEAVDQYAWPVQRILLFLPLALVLTIFYFYWVRQIFIPTGEWSLTKNSSVRLIDLMTLSGFIGAVSIWPAKISVFYAFFIFLSLFAFNRLNKKIDKIIISS